MLDKPKKTFVEKREAFHCKRLECVRSLVLFHTLRVAVNNYSVKLLPSWYLLYRHECFTGKYIHVSTTRKIHKNYIPDPSGVFSIISQVSLSMT